MMPATLSVMPSMLPSATLAALLGPLSGVALVATGVAFVGLIIGMVVEHRDARALRAMTADVVPFPGRPGNDRAAA